MKIKGINELNLHDISQASNTTIRQGFGLPDTIDRNDSKDEIQHYGIFYRTGSFLKTGVFEFDISGIRRKKYADTTLGPKYRKDKDRVGTIAKYRIRIKPSKEITSYTQLLNEHIYIYCGCKDFRYVFMDTAFRGLGYHMEKYGLIPITEHPDFVNLKRLTPEYDAVADKKKANVRNPRGDGSACKHILYLADLLNDYNIENVDAVIKDIKKRKEYLEKKATEQPLRAIKTGQDKRFVDDEGMPKGRQQIERERDKIIRSILSINANDIKRNKLLNLGDFKTSEDREAIKSNARQKLWEFDSYYIRKAQEEIDSGATHIKETTYYLPDDWEEAYEKIEKHFEEIFSDLDKQAEIEDLTRDRIKKGTKLGRTEIDDILDAEPEDDIDKVLNPSDDEIGDILGESHIINYKNFLKKTNLD